MKKSEAQDSEFPSRLIDARIEELGDWRGEMLSRLRALVKQADPEVVEEWKWRGVPVWSHAGIICTGETYKNVVKMTFAKGASLEDPSSLFNSSLEGKVRRAIDFHEGDEIDEKALKALIRAAVALNTSSAAKRDAAKPTLLAGGNPQIAKADGGAPVQAYIAAMPGWKRDVGRRLDALIVRTVPGVRKAVKWNSPLYGVGGQGWFLGIHCFTKYIKVAFFRGASLRPVPPRRVQGQAYALLPHPRGRPARRGARGKLDQAGIGAARLGPVAPAVGLPAGSAAGVPGCQGAGCRSSLQIWSRSWRG